MIDALYNGITGLNTFQGALNSESNNIANINTVGYKADKISFADQLNGAGVRVQTVDKNLNQGDLKLTGTAYDMAIEGKGFFAVQGSASEINYTRAGNFRMAADGTLQTANGYPVLGAVANHGDVVSSDATTAFDSRYSQFITSNIISSLDGVTVESFNAKATDYNFSATDDAETKLGDFYKTKESKIFDVQALTTALRESLVAYASNPVEGVAATSQVTEISFDPTQITGDNNTIELFVGNNLYREMFDTDAATTLKNLADNISELKAVRASYDEVTNTLRIESMIPGEEVVVADAKVTDNGTDVNPLPTIDTTDAVAGSGRAKVLATELALKEALEIAGASYLRIDSTITNDLANLELGQIQMNLKTLGVSANAFGDLESENGYLYINQDGTRIAVGKIAVARFDNDLGLEPLGGNLFGATRESGERSFVGTESVVLSKTLELSNAQIGGSLVDLMVYQRSFEASSKAVTTSDEFLKTAIALKK